MRIQDHIKKHASRIRRVLDIYLITSHASRGKRAPVSSAIIKKRWRKYILGLFTLLVAAKSLRGTCRAYGEASQMAASKAVGFFTSLQSKYTLIQLIMLDKNIHGDLMSK